MSVLSDLGAHIAASMTDAIEGQAVHVGELTLHARTDKIATVLTFLRDDPRCRFTTLIDICGVDYPERAKRFDIVYHLLSMHLNQRIRVKVATDTETAAPSVAHLFPCADWFEREAFDMYGILFSNHPGAHRAGGVASRGRGRLMALLPQAALYLAALKRALRPPTSPQQGTREFLGQVYGARPSQLTNPGTRLIPSSILRVLNVRETFRPYTTPHTRRGFFRNLLGLPHRGRQLDWLNNTPELRDLDDMNMLHQYRDLEGATPPGRLTEYADADTAWTPERAARLDQLVNASFEHVNNHEGPSYTAYRGRRPSIIRTKRAVRLSARWCASPI